MAQLLVPRLASNSVEVLAVAEPTPIETLRLALIATHEGNLGNGHFANLANCPVPRCADARLALESVAAVVAKSLAMPEPRGHTDWDTDYCVVCASKEVRYALPPNPLSHDEDCPWIEARDALVPFGKEGPWVTSPS